MPWPDRGRECDGYGANGRCAPRHAPPNCAGRDRHAWPPGHRQAPGQAASWYVGNDQADTKLAGGAAVLLGGIGLITVQGGGQGEGGAQGVQGRQQGVAVDVLGRHDVLGQDEVGRLMGDQGVFVPPPDAPAAAFTFATEAGVGIHGVGDAVGDLPAAVRLTFSQNPLQQGTLRLDFRDGIARQ